MELKIMPKSAIITLILMVFSIPVTGQRDFSVSEITKVVLLGTGNPNPSPDHSGCSVAILVNGTPYIIDFGPGMVRMAAAMSTVYGGPFACLNVKNLKHAFLTHLHSDHTAGYADLILTPWVMGRDEPLQVWGPEGITRMTEHIYEAYREDIAYRIYGDEPGNDQGWRVSCHEINEEGVIYQDSNITVEAFPVSHGTWPNAWGFRFRTPDMMIVVSGDTSPNANLEKYARSADILIHEVYSMKGFNKKSPEWKKYHSGHHTSTTELGRICLEAQPKLTVLYHILSWDADEAEMLAEIAEIYPGKVIAGRDKDIY